MDFAKVVFKNGENTHNGDVLWHKQPVRHGFHAVFFSGAVVGPFETSREAYSIGLGNADFSRVIQVS